LREIRYNNKIKFLDVLKIKALASKSGDVLVSWRNSLIEKTMQQINS
jgi:hypothetical protein